MDWNLSIHDQAKKASRNNDDHVDHDQNYNTPEYMCRTDINNTLTTRDACDPVAKNLDDNVGLSANAAMI
jgi:hypothetical protein